VEKQQDFRVCVWVGGWVGVGAQVLACACSRAALLIQWPFCLQCLWLYHIFPHYLINGTIFGKEKITENKMFVLIFFTTFI
jgi:hypothetical protein